LFKNEIEEFKNELLEIENFIYNYILSNKLGWKNNKKQICELLVDFKLPKNLISKMIEAIKIAPMPKIAVIKTPSVNLEEYTDSAFVRI
jgi:hypothetical protein